jgi:two-component system, sensor histidine kinase and response regulator
MSARIIIVEDERLVAQDISETLKKRGYIIPATFADGPAVIEKLAQLDPDLVLLDINIRGGLDGISVAEYIQKHHDIPVVYLTAYADESTLNRAKATQPFGYLIKPFREDELCAAVAIALETHQAQKRRFSDLRDNIAVALPHELTTPIHSIIGFSQLLISEYATLDKQLVLDFAKHIHKAAERLDHLVQRYLFHSYLEVLRRDPDQQKTLKQVPQVPTSAIIKSNASAIAQNNSRLADLTFDLQESILAIGLNYLSRIVIELVENACKFSDPGTTIAVQSFQELTNFHLVITSHGREMTAEQIMNVDAFVQFERKHHEQQGVGLGLNLVKLVAQLHGGQLQITSHAGTTSTCVILPIH